MKEIILIDGTKITQIGDIYLCPKCNSELDVYWKYVECRTCGFKLDRK